MHMKYWYIALYKISEIQSVEHNLSSQKIDYYLPKIFIKKINNRPKEEALFPGYIFIHSNFEKLSLVKYSKGIRYILRFGEKYPFMKNDEINNIKLVENSSYLKPLQQRFEIGEEIDINSGPFKGEVAKICSLHSKERVKILLTFLGKPRKIFINENNLMTRP